MAKITGGDFLHPHCHCQQHEHAGCSGVPRVCSGGRYTFAAAGPLEPYARRPSEWYTISRELAPDQYEQQDLHHIRQHRFQASPFAGLTEDSFEWKLLG